MKPSFKKALILMSLSILCSPTFASNFKVGDLYYDLLSENSCAVSRPPYGENDYKYKENIIIPSEVTYDGKKYSVTAIWYGAFSGCSGLTDVTIPNSVTIIGIAVITIGNYAFRNCTGLTNIAIPNSVSIIGSGAFYRCHSLTSITIPNSVTTIKAGSFAGCISLTSVTIGDGVETIRNGAFAGCRSLTDFSSGTSLKSIGQKAFDGCTSMKKFVAKTQMPPTCENGALDGINKETCILYVPAAGMNAYKTTEVWKEFFHYTSIETGIKGMKADNTAEMERFSLDGTRLTAPQKGINIVRMSDGTTRKVMVK